jgi:response regulator NasT
MARSMLQRRLVDVSERLKRLRAELAVAEEQLQFLEEQADEARLRALVSETPLADAEARDARRHADTMARHRDALVVATAELAREQDALLDRMASEPAPSRPASTNPAAPPKTRVVVAEDEAIIRLDLKELLEEEGYDVVGETGRGDEAVELVRTLRPDVRLAAILILTAFSQRDLVERARDAGALAYLVKPFQRSDLVPAIELARARHAELLALEEQISNLAERLEARTLVDRAKGRLMDGHAMTEEQAFRFLQRRAMDGRRPIADVAREVIAGELTP